MSLLMGVPATARAQEERMDVTVTLDAKEAQAGTTVMAKVKLDVKVGFHTYPTKQKDPAAASFVTKIRIKDKASPVEVTGQVKEPAPTEHFVELLKATVGHHESPVELEVPIKIKPGTPAGAIKFALTIDTQVCDDKGCLPYEKAFDLTLTVKPGNATPKSDPPGDAGRPSKGSAPVTTMPAPVGTKPEAATPTSTTSDTAAPSGGRRSDEPQTLIGFIRAGVFWGFVTLLTPCVFPMIPITVSYFLKQESEGKNAFVHAFVYTGTIIVAMTIIAFAFVGAFQSLIQWWQTNLLLGLLFVVFALSLFGMFEITLPSFITRWTSQGEAKGGYVGTVFMALTFTVISFSCVAPFLGGFAGTTAAERPMLWNVAGALGFSVAFASLFLLLALFPSYIKKLPKSGNWLNNMKVVMGFLEVAAALKFLRAAELLATGSNPKILTYDFVLGMYVALCLLCGLYLLGMYQLPHDHSDDKRIGVGRLVWSFLFIALGFYLTPGLFRAPNGEKLQPAGTIYSWIDSFLLPGSDTRPIAGGASSSDPSLAPLKWIGFLDTALVDARQKKQRIFIDFTGET